MRVRVRWCLLLALTAMAGKLITAQDAGTAYLPMMFHSESGAIRTRACLQIKERSLVQSKWWEESAPTTAGAEQAFRTVISAMKAGDREALFHASDLTQRGDVKKFDGQARAYFEQLRVIEIVSVPRVFEFDGLAAFVASLRSGVRTTLVPFVFLREEDRRFAFLPNRTDLISFVLLQDSLKTTSGEPPVNAPPSCSVSDVRSATHQVSLAPANGRAWEPSRLLLHGIPLGAASVPGSPASRIKMTVDRMKLALADGRLDEFTKDMTLEGGTRLARWYATASAADREQYVKAFTQQEPSFLFDESPLAVVYTRMPSGVVQVLYFTMSSAGEWLWSNSSHVTNSDQVFKRDPLRASASLSRPFSNLAIR